MPKKDFAILGYYDIYLGTPDLNHVQARYLQILFIYSLKTFLHLSHFNVGFIKRKEMEMKKISIILMIGLVLAFAGCAKEKAEQLPRSMKTRRNGGRLSPGPRREHQMSSFSFWMTLVLRRSEALGP
jgi:hypothetical protein